jgi:hypothetical protein
MYDFGTCDECLGKWPEEKARKEEELRRAREIKETQRRSKVQRNYFKNERKELDDGVAAFYRSRRQQTQQRLSKKDIPAMIRAIERMLRQDRELCLKKHGKLAKGKGELKDTNQEPAAASLLQLETAFYHAPDAILKIESANLRFITLLKFVTFPSIVGFA